MAAAARTTAHAVEQLRALEAEPHRFGFFAALRRLECLFPDRPRIGAAARPNDEALRLGQVPSLAFASSTLAEFEQGGPGEPARLTQYFFGLFGPNGPLPLHLSEYAHGRELNYSDPTFRRFADVFHHRLISLFYRAWANAQPALSLDRPAPRRFDVYVGSLIGAAAPEFRGHASMPDEARLALAGRFGLGTRPAEGLEELLGEFFGFRFRIRQFMGEWLRLSPKDRLELGGGATAFGRDGGAAATLGGGAVLGRAVFSRRHTFQVVCGPLRYEELTRLLPGEPSLAKLRDLVRGYVGDELAWTLRLVLRRDEVPECRLGAAGQLGWTTWLGKRAAASDADDVVIAAGN